MKQTSSVSSRKSYNMQKINQYKLIKTLGSGAFGTVYLCENTEDD